MIAKARNIRTGMKPLLTAYSPLNTPTLRSYIVEVWGVKHRYVAYFSLHCAFRPVSYRLSRFSSLQQASGVYQIRWATFEAATSSRLIALPLSIIGPTRPLPNESESLRGRPLQGESIRNSQQEAYGNGPMVQGTKKKFPSDCNQVLVGRFFMNTLKNRRLSNQP